MAQIDHARAWLCLKDYVLTRTSHGQHDLLAALARIELDCQLDDPEAPGRLVQRSTEGHVLPRLVESG